jgi:hypothetical protein
LEGPTTLQLSFTAAITGTFIRGEPITQTTSGATGECIGTVYDSTVPLGWMIIAPRTGTFDATDVLTGGWSGATVTPTTLYTYRRQIVFYKTSGSTRIGGSWYQCVRMDTESADLFSTLASNAACTATVPPGGSITSGNRFPANQNSYVIRATNNSTNDGATALSVTDGHYDKTVEGWNNTNSAYCNGRIHTACVSAMPKSGASADGSWYIVHHNTNAASPSTSLGVGTLLHFCRMDTVEPGEAELYYVFSNGRGNATTRNISYSDQYGSGAGGSAFVVSTSFWQFFETSSSSNVTASAHQYLFKGIQARAAGTTGTLSYVNGYPGFTCIPTGGNDTISTSHTSRMVSASAVRILNHPNATQRPIFRESPVVFSGQGGRSRWIFSATVGSNYDTLDNKTFFCISPYSSSSSIPAMWLGPLDGSTQLLAT